MGRRARTWLSLPVLRHEVAVVADGLCDWWVGAPCRPMHWEDVLTALLLMDAAQPQDHPGGLTLRVELLASLLAHD